MRLETVQEILGHDGEFLTVDAEVGRTGEDGARQIESRWTTLRHQLEEAGVGAGLLEEIGSRLTEPTHLPGEQRRTIVAVGDRVALDDVHALHASWPETVDVGVLPDLRGWLRAEDAALPFLLVRIDRVGADLEMYAAASRPPTAERSVHGLDYYITKVQPGDWAQKQFQQTAENRWQHNAEEVAEAARSMARRHRPLVMLVCGDVRARADLVNAWSERDTPVVALKSGGRASGVSDDAMWSEVESALAAVEAERDRVLVDRLAEGVSNGVAVSGLAPVLDALVQQRVDTLLVDLAGLEDMTVRPQEHPGLVLPPRALEADELPADRALVAGAALSGAQVALLPAEMMPAGPVAALLRWSD
ncbi:baeRF2 domain-containing protein [Nocardioides terrisoli]|uniref:baeRF2 domain-containing protein n=1 Tax=Nocardioides terrisoli TaxID=3388267 RepID=UPI00287B7AFC|nr:Vms1/Ankzf1 family peptidyl-tRNA hydrolase [Nocardioides marmorisolisilvae]